MSQRPHIPRRKRTIKLLSSGYKFLVSRLFFQLDEPGFFAYQSIEISPSRHLSIFRDQPRGRSFDPGSLYTVGRLINLS